MQVFPNIEVSVGTNPIVQVKVLSSRFGDGYEQTSADGINNVYNDWQVVFNQLSLVDGQRV